MGLTVVPSEANFVMLVFQDADQVSRIVEELLTLGIIVRPLKAFGLPHCLRVSTGTDEDNQQCVSAMQKALMAVRV